jgi:membrane protease YdiL (CAAX protease family)
VRGTSAGRVAVFLVTTLVLSSLAWMPIATSGSRYSDNNLVLLGFMWSPGIAGLATPLAFRRSLRGHGWGWGATRYQAAAYSIPLLVCLVVYGIAWLTGIGRFSAAELNSSLGQDLGGVELPLVLSVLLLSTVGILLNSVGALGEEIGWGGFLVPELAREWRFTGVALTSGIIWAVYHYPLMVTSGYRGTTPLWYSVLFFTITTASICLVYAWLRLKSGSLWRAVILHAAHNLFVQVLLDGATIESGATEYITTEFGAGMALMYVLLVLEATRRARRRVGEEGRLTGAPSARPLTSSRRLRGHAVRPWPAAIRQAAPMKEREHADSNTLSRAQRCLAGAG